MTLGKRIAYELSDRTAQGGLIGGILWAALAWGIAGGWNWIYLLGLYDPKIVPVLLAVLIGFLVGATIGGLMSWPESSVGLFIGGFVLLGLSIALTVPFTAEFFKRVDMEVAGQYSYLEPRMELGGLLILVLLVDALAIALLPLLVFVRGLPYISSRIGQLRPELRGMAAGISLVLTLVIATWTSWTIDRRVGGGSVTSEDDAARSGLEIAKSNGWEVERIEVVARPSIWPGSVFGSYDVTLFISGGDILSCSIEHFESPPTKCQDL